MTKRKIVVCGLPHSGNNLINKMLRIHGFDTSVKHYNMDLDPGTKVAIMPLRSKDIQWLSCKRDSSLTEQYSQAWWMHYEHFWPMLRNLAKIGAVVIPVNYEDIVANPEKLGEHLASVLEFEWQGWHVPVYDGNEKYK